jgi:hypothetical protein
MALTVGPPYEHKGLTQIPHGNPDLNADIGYFLRPGRHGTTLRDWMRRMDLMDSHFNDGRLMRLTFF